MNPYKPPESGRPKYQKPRVEIDWADLFIVLFILLAFPVMYGFILESEIVQVIFFIFRTLL